VATDFSLSEEHLDDRRLVVSVRGELDLFTAPDLKQRLASAIENGARQVIVDLEGATSIDSTTLGVLIAAVKRLRESEGDLRVVCSDPRIARTFEITGLTGVFEVLATRDAALRRIVANE
jgi:anti-sigma B factor antagonist